MRMVALQIQQTWGYFIQTKSLAFLGAGTERKQLEDWFDAHVNPDNEIQAYESWLDADDILDEPKGLWKGRPDYMPKI